MAIHHQVWNTTVSEKNKMKKDENYEDHDEQWSFLWQPVQFAVFEFDKMLYKKNYIIDER